MTDSIAQAVATINVTGYTGVYDAVYHSATGSASGVGGNIVGTLSLGASFQDVPGGTAHWTFTGNGNYADQSGEVAIVISKARLTLAVSGRQSLWPERRRRFERHHHRRSKWRPDHCQLHEPGRRCERRPGNLCHRRCAVRFGEQANWPATTT